MNPRQPGVFAAIAIVIGLATAAATATAAAAQTPQKLTLAQAREMAVRNHPRVASAESTAQVASAVTGEARSAYFPTANGSLTTAGAIPNSRIAAGALNNPIIYNRYSNGLAAGQLITDFGRTANLVRGAELHAQAATENVQATRAAILLRVSETYLGVLRSQALLEVAQATVKERQVLADQTDQLAKHKLKSGLDVSFAKVNLEQARLLLAQAENALAASQATLIEALGSPTQAAFELEEAPLPSAPPADVSPLLDQAMRERPEVAGQRLNQEAAQKQVTAERDLWFPTVSAVGAAGYTPVSQHTLADRYAAAGLNVNVPIFNGHLFGARRAEAEARARVESANLRDLQDQIARDVRTAWLDDRTAYERLALTRQLLDESQLAMQLAQARYKLGLASIVELSQADLALTQAQIEQAAARYDFQIADTRLQFQLGSLR